MKFVEFLGKSKSIDFWQNRNLTCFKSENYSSLFVNLFFEYLVKNEILPAQYQTILLDSTDNIKLLSSLEQSFLGQKIFYWLGEYKSEKSSKKQFDLLEYIPKYKGPNFIALYLTDEKNLSKKIKEIDFIDIEDTVNQPLCESILKFFDKNFNEKKIKLIKKFFQQTNNISLDKALMLIQYLELISVNEKNENIVLNYMISMVVDDQPSLNLLAQYFFAKQPEQFFKIWSCISDQYPEIFWINFWSEQIWRAYYFVKFSTENNFAKAKVMSFRLPFKFTKTDWKSVSLDQLEKSFQFIYKNDFALKTGSTFCSLELFYFNFFISKQI